MTPMPPLHTPTLFAALALSNAIMAGAWWFAFMKTARAGLRPWACGLALQAFAAVVLLRAPERHAEPFLVAAGVLMVYGYSLQARAVSAFLECTTSKLMLHMPPVVAFLALTGMAVAPGTFVLPASSEKWVFALHGLTVALSFGFLLVHKTRAHALATLDPLTGLYNRRIFNELADAALSRARRVDAPVAVLALDLDLFKRVNDAYGHLAGDQVLAAFAKLLRNTLRKEDLVARYGGEEFVALLPDTTQTAAAGLAERIRANLAEADIKAAGNIVRITVSIGLASQRGRELSSLQAMLARADEALYSAKMRGRNRVVLHDAAIPSRFGLHKITRRSSRARSSCGHGLRRQRA